MFLHCEELAAVHHRWYTDIMHIIYVTLQAMRANHLLVHVVVAISRASPIVCVLSPLIELLHTVA